MKPGYRPYRSRACILNHLSAVSVEHEKSAPPLHNSQDRGLPLCAHYYHYKFPVLICSKRQEVGEMASSAAFHRGKIQVGFWDFQEGESTLLLYHCSSPKFLAFNPDVSATPLLLCKGLRHHLVVEIKNTPKGMSLVNPRQRKQWSEARKGSRKQNLLMLEAFFVHSLLYTASKHVFFMPACSRTQVLPSVALTKQELESRRPKS